MLTKVWHGETQIADGVLALCGPVLMPGANLAEAVLFLRATGPENIDRRAKEQRVSFEIVRQHAGPIDAVRFRAQHNALLANVADLKFEWSLGGETCTATMARGWWQTVDVQLIGSVATRAAYVVTGGSLAISDPISTGDGDMLLTGDGTPILT